MCYLGRGVESFNRTEERNFDLRLIQKVQLKNMYKKIIKISFNGDDGAGDGDGE